MILKIKPFSTCEEDFIENDGTVRVDTQYIDQIYYEPSRSKYGDCALFTKFNDNKGVLFITFMRDQNIEVLEQWQRWKDERTAKPLTTKSMVEGHKMINPLLGDRI